MGCCKSKIRFKPEVMYSPDTKGSVVRVKALYEYEGRNEGDLAFKQGDRLEVEAVENEGSEIKFDGWLSATHTVTKKTGFIPGNYVRIDDDSLENQDWWYDIDRGETQRLMLRPGMAKGSYLIRNASDDARCKVLSILDLHEDGVPYTKHYKIRTLDNGGCYINAKRTFNTISDLVDNYKHNNDGLCCQLTQACPRSKPTHLLFEDLDVSSSDIKLGKKIGAGFFGNVYLGTLRSVIDVAVKTLKAAASMTDEQFLTEAKVMHALNHERLVSVIAVVSEPHNLMIVTEYMANGSLLKYIRSDEGRKTQFPIILTMASQIAEGMAYLEGQNFVHRDLRADNVLVGEHYDVKVADFGLTRILDDDDVYMASENTKFPIKWTAPEAANYRQFTIKSDVWSFGVVLYELITHGGELYAGMSGQETLRRVDKGYRMPNPTTPAQVCPEKYYELMKECWNKKAEARPTFEYFFDVFQHYDVSTENQYPDCG